MIRLARWRLTPRSWAISGIATSEFSTRGAYEKILRTSNLLLLLKRNSGPGGAGTPRGRGQHLQGGTDVAKGSEARDLAPNGAPADPRSVPAGRPSGRSRAAIETHSPENLDEWWRAQALNALVSDVCPGRCGPPFSPLFVGKSLGETTRASSRDWAKDRHGHQSERSDTGRRDSRQVRPSRRCPN